MGEELEGNFSHEPTTTLMIERGVGMIASYDHDVWQEVGTQYAVPLILIGRLCMFEWYVYGKGFQLLGHGHHKQNIWYDENEHTIIIIHNNVYVGLTMLYRYPLNITHIQSGCDKYKGIFCRIMLAPQNVCVQILPLFTFLRFSSEQCQAGLRIFLNLLIYLIFPKRREDSIGVLITQSVSTLILNLKITICVIHGC